MMAHLTFSAHCAKGHDRIEFTDREAFEAHMTRAHTIRRLRPGGAALSTNDRKAPGWTDGHIDKPYAWEAPRRTPGGLERVAYRIQNNEYRWPNAAPWEPAAEVA
jgi:hypothetical protein